MMTIEDFGHKVQLQSYSLKISIKNVLYVHSFKKYFYTFIKNS